MDYALPRAADAPFFAFESHPVPATTNPLGAKGCGEAGCAGSLPAVMNALVDALREVGVTHIDMPATPQAVWAAIQAARRGNPLPNGLGRSHICWPIAPSSPLWGRTYSAEGRARRGRRA